MVDRGALQGHADEFRAAGLLGQPGPLSRLFDFLLERSLSGATPKELEIAVQVFGKRPGDVGQDSVVRVYVHKLRRRLDEYYARTTDRDSRITLPKGEYRLIVEPLAGSPDRVILPRRVPELPSESIPQSQPRWAAWPRHLTLALAVIVAFLAGLLVDSSWFSGKRAEGELRDLRASALWAPLLDDELPITVIVGDYYLLGEVDEAGNVRRLAREFFINSNADFRDHLQLDPQLMNRYRDLDLTYLPAASAIALQGIAPIFGRAKPVRIMLMSEADASAFKSGHVVYIGYISGMGMLADTVFAGSRIELGGSYDELVDTQGGMSYVSTATTVASGGAAFRDYGYLSSFDGPAGNRIVVISGTRDRGVVHAAEAAANIEGVRQLESAAAKSAAFEALYEVFGLANTSLNAKLLFVSSVVQDRLWQGE